MSAWVYDRPAPEVCTVEVALEWPSGLTGTMRARFAHGQWQAADGQTIAGEPRAYAWRMLDETPPKEPATNLIFYGGESSLRRWRELVSASIKRACGPVSPATGRPGAAFEVALTPTEREQLMAHWYEESGTGSLASGKPYRWNDCITFLEARDEVTAANMVREAFTLGFLISREGFNGEIAVDGPAPTDLPDREELAEFPDDEEPEVAARFLRLRELAVQSLLAEVHS